MIVTQDGLPFQYISEKKSSGLIGFSGLPLYLELASKSGFIQAIQESLRLKKGGWTDTELILSLILINIAGGDCISDIERLEQDAGLRTLLLQFATHGKRRKARRAYANRWRKQKKRGLPSNAAIHRYLRQFHSPEEELKREEGKAFIPSANSSLQALIGLNKSLIASMQQQSPSTQATLDQDATITSTCKRKALYCYKKHKAYQPINTYWAEHGIVLHTEFRDGNVPGGFEQLRVLREALELLPTTVRDVSLRSDSAGYQEELLQYCAEGKNKRFGVIEFAIALKVSAAFKTAVKEVKPETWQVLYKKNADGTQIKTDQEWAEVCFVPNWAAVSKQQATYRYIAIREVLQPGKTERLVDDADLPFPTMQDNDVTYKLFGLVTNRDIEGCELIQWHRERCGKSEQVHSSQKEDLCGGQLPSNLFGVNAAWWHIMNLSFNLNRLLQLVGLPNKFKEKRMKALRFHLIQLPGRVIKHARKIWVRVEEEAYELYAFIRDRIANLIINPIPLEDTS